MPAAQPITISISPTGRAGGLRQWLIERFGFRAERIAAEGRGEEEPVASGNSQADHARNRRVELRLLD